jgi:endonuclease-3
VSGLPDQIYFVCPNCKSEISYDSFVKSKCCSCGKFLSFKDKRIKREINEGKKEDSEDMRVRKLLELREKIRAEDLVPVLVKDAAIVIRDDPFAFILAGVLDRGTKAEIIWTIPYYLKRRLGKLDPQYFADASLEELSRLIQSLPTRPRYTNDAPRTIKELSKIVVNEYSGDARKIWESKSARSVEATVRRVYGVGPGIASMITLLLERWFKVDFTDLDHRQMDVKADVHVMRVFKRLGFINELTPEAALIAARRLNPDYPGALDAASWMIGRNYCNASNPACFECPMDSRCPKIL